MNKKIIGILVCTLLIVFVIPTSGSVFGPNNAEMQDPNQNYRERVKHLDDERLPPDPGDVSPDFVFETNEIEKINTNPPVKTLISNEETIIDILENIDEDLVVGYLEDLVAFGPRYTGTSACEQAGDYIYDEFVSYGLEARYDDWTYSSYSGNNIEGTLPGIDETSDEIYIICAHYDTVSSSPGADDDGSGTAAVLAAAYIMSQYEFNHTIRFVAFDGEEQGLLGSYRYAEEAYGNGDNIVAVLNGDMIGYATNPTEASMVKIYENTASSWITDFTDEVSQNYEGFFELTVVPSGSSGGSDHASFWDFDYHAIFYHEYKFNDYYHSSQDIIENMDTDYCTRVTRLEIATLGELAEAQPMSEAPETPTKPDGPDEWIIDVETTFSSTTTDPEGESIYYLFDWGDGTDSGWIGPYASGQTVEASHSWSELGDYEVKVMAKDEYNAKSNWSESAILSIVENEQPTKVAIDGPSVGFGGTEYEFTFVSTDADGHDLYYRVNWDDGDDTGWLGPYASGETVTLSHKWKTKAEYWIKAWAKDTVGGESRQASHKINILTSNTRPISRNVLIAEFLENFMGRFPNAFPILQQMLGL